MIEVAEADLRAALHVERWITEVAAGSPFADWTSLRDTAAAATPLAPAEIDEAMASHPRIGEKPTGSGAAADFSRAEQLSAPDVEDQHLAAALAEGNATYEKRFGRVFLIRAAGRSRAEIVDELDRRLKLDDASELEIVGEELRDIALLRLEKSYGDPA
jgi:2-oxo-4-hydroxy-4-carboxy-5-ureidoimidazoline decarboxylase